MLKRFLKCKLIAMSLVLSVLFGCVTVNANEITVQRKDQENVYSGKVIDIQYFIVHGDKMIISDSPINSGILTQQSNNSISGKISYYYKGLDSQKRPKYNVTATITSSNLAIKSSNLKTKPEGVNDYIDHKANHAGKVAVNSHTYVYTSKNPPLNAYCEVKLYVTDSENVQTYIGYTKLKNAIS